MKVSIIVAAYNAERYIGCCLDSVLAQTMPDFEVIVADDGSKDATAQIVDAFSARDRRVRVIHKENGGVSSARNAGLEKATGEWLFFLDADDRLKPDGLSLLLEHGTDADAVFGGYEVFDEEGNLTYAIPERVEMCMDKYQALEQMFKPWHYRYYGYVWGKLFRSATIKGRGLRFDESIVFNEDRLFAVAYICGVDRVSYFTAPVYEYMENPSSAMASLSKAFNPRFFTDLDAFRKMKRLLGKLPEADRVMPLMKQEAGMSFRRLSQMIREKGVKGRVPQIRLYAKMLGILSFKEFCSEALFPLLFHRER